MKYKYTFILIHLLIFSPISLAMHIAPYIQQPTHVACLQNKVYAIAGANGFILFDKKTSQYTHLQEQSKIDDFAVNITKTKIATSINGILTVYDATTKEIVWSHDTHTQQFTPITFNSQHENELVAYIYPDQLKFFTDQNNYETRATIRAISPSQTRITCHPKKQDIAYLVKVPGSFNSEEITVYARHKEPITCSKWNCEADNCILCGSNETNVAYEYDSTGKCAAKLHYNGCCFIFDTIHSVLPASNTIPFSTVHIASAFHPNQPILALLTDKYELEYYTLTYDNPIKSRIIVSLAEYDTPLTLDKHSIYKIGKRLTFSLSGKKLIVALANKCFIVPVPFDVLYKPEKKQQLISLFWALKNNTFMTAPLPIDIMRLIMKTQLKIYC